MFLTNRLTSVNFQFMRKMEKWNNFIALFTLVVCLCLCHGRSKAQEDLGGFDKVMKELMSHCNAPGAQFAIAKDGQLKYFKGYGIANMDTGETVTTGHVFRFNSISKVITGTAILKLIEEGKLTLEDKPFVMLSDLEPPTGAKVDERIYNITIKNLLQHMGGWDTTQLMYDVVFMAGNLMVSQALGHVPPPTAKEMIRFMKGIALGFNPGAAFAYSNIGYVTLGRVIEKTSGLSYFEYVQRNMLVPLGLKGIRLGKARLQDLAPNEVRYYGVDGVDVPFASIFPQDRGFVNQSYGTLDFGNLDSVGGWIGTAGELVKFIDHNDGLRKPRILSEDTMYMRLHSVRGNLTSFYRGLDVFVDVDQKGSVVDFWHSGASPGSHSLFTRLVDLNVTFAYLFNTLPSDTNFTIMAADKIAKVAKGIANWP